MLPVMLLLMEHERGLPLTPVTEGAADAGAVERE
jgi:hypothetical protein